MKQESKKKIYDFEREVSMIKKLREMQKILLNTGAYSESNMEKQNMQFDKVNVPQWERDIITKMWSVNNMLSHKLLKEIDIFLDELIKEFNLVIVSKKENTAIDVLKRKMKQDVDNI
jgi:predicted HAD superfamily phosphohydrolase